jgi:hypothetical protein
MGEDLGGAAEEVNSVNFTPFWGWEAPWKSCWGQPDCAAASHAVEHAAGVGLRYRYGRERSENFVPNVKLMKKNNHTVLISA